MRSKPVQREATDHISIILFYIYYSISSISFFIIILLFYSIFCSLLSAVIDKKEKDEISSPASLVAFEEEEISSLRQPTLACYPTVALGWTLCQPRRPESSCRPRCPEPWPLGIYALLVSRSGAGPRRPRRCEVGHGALWQ